MCAAICRGEIQACWGCLSHFTWTSLKQQNHILQPKFYFDHCISISSHWTFQCHLTFNIRNLSPLKHVYTLWKLGKLLLPWDSIRRYEMLLFIIRIHPMCTLNHCNSGNIKGIFLGSNIDPNMGHRIWIWAYKQEHCRWNHREVKYRAFKLGGIEIHHNIPYSCNQNTSVVV